MKTFKRWHGKNYSVLFEQGKFRVINDNGYDFGLWSSWSCFKKFFRDDVKNPENLHEILFDK